VVITSAPRREGLGFEFSLGDDTHITMLLLKNLRKNIFQINGICYSQLYYSYYYYEHARKMYVKNKTNIFLIFHIFLKLIFISFLAAGQRIKNGSPASAMKGPLMK
jgi:hypothetical protein